jgi:transposase, IS30 family
MSHYHHLSITEREKILVLRPEGKSLRAISVEIGRSVSTISREFKRNGRSDQSYSAIEAQRKYYKRRKKCRRHKLLSNVGLKETVRRLFLELQWSPEQISNRLLLENSIFTISYSTIYRAIYAGLFDTLEQRRSEGNRGAIRKLRHRGKTRRRRGTVETRGKIVISNRIQERPKEADDRQVIGHWEADTLAGKTGSACLVTITDRCSRYLLAGKLTKRYSALVADEMIRLLSALPMKKRKTITPDRGKEFSKHSSVTKALNGLRFYFPDPHAPWQRGTNENTNGLLREYLPKSFDIALSSESDIAGFINKLNFRPRKCLGWKSPHEVFFNRVLRLT